LEDICVIEGAPQTSTITFVQADGTEVVIGARAGMSLMEAALRANVQGIDAKCRGNCACVTCHVYIDPRWRSVLGPPGPMEESMLDFAEDVDGRSRLSCQVRIDDLCDGLTVQVPAEQRILGF
jgi:ferredoxin, 2Fe-2S